MPRSKRILAPVVDRHRHDSITVFINAGSSENQSWGIVCEILTVKASLLKAYSRMTNTVLKLNSLEWFPNQFLGQISTSAMRQNFTSLTNLPCLPRHIIISPLMYLVGRSDLTDNRVPWDKIHSFPSLPYSWRKSISFSFLVRLAVQIITKQPTCITAIQQRPSHITRARQKIDVTFYWPTNNMTPKVRRSSSGDDKIPCGRKAFGHKVKSL
jgi:hypothetical protein